MAPATTVLTNGGALELRSQSSDLIPSLFKHQTGGRQRHQTVDAVAIHDPWLVVEMRRDSRGNGGLGSGDLLDG